MPYAYARGDNCYGRGDYYRGDYYRGDGLFGSIGKFLGGVAKTAVSLLPGPVGAIARGVTGIGRGSVSIGPGAGPAGIPMIGGGGAQPIGFPEFGPSGGGMEPQPVGTMTAKCFVPGVRLRGTRPNKSGYYKQVTKGDPTRVVYIPKGSVCVTSRRLNVANPRALRRSIRRAQGFAKLARRVMTFVQAKAPKGRPKFKKSR